MKRIISLTLCLFAILSNAYADEYQENYNLLSDDYVGGTSNIRIDRPINGGTIIIPEFDTSCPEEMKGPFEYACKIVEEYMPPCMPLRVRVSCGRLHGSSNDAISKLTFLSIDSIGYSTGYDCVPMSVVKGVILDEFCYGSTISYYEEIPSIGYLQDRPDITITYNSAKLNDLYMSLDTLPGNQYDFVSVAIRDLVAGLGLRSDFTYNSSTRSIELRSHLPIPFEKYIDNLLGKTTAERLTNATRGTLTLKYNNKQSLKLYAPTTWKDGLSLNYFMPQDDSSVSQILSYSFGRGTLMRSLADNYARFIFRDLLGWRANFTTGDNDGPSIAGSASLRMPYNGSITIDMSADDNSNDMQDYTPTYKAPTMRSSEIDEEKRSEAHDYMYQFHPLKPGGAGGKARDISISILKKDGTWDVVKNNFDYFPEAVSFAMSDLKFNYSEEEYARTADGLFRARITKKDLINGERTKYTSRFFAIEYLPQKIGMTYKRNVSSASRAANTEIRSANNGVRLHFSNLEGATRVVLERLRPGARVPSKTEITDFKCGYYDTTVDRTTIFTAVAYNGNGSSRSIPVEIAPLAQTANIRFELADQVIRVKTDLEERADLQYAIAALDIKNPRLVTSGTTTEEVDISELPKGTYSLTVDGEVCDTPAVFKFQK